MFSGVVTAQAREMLTVKGRGTTEGEKRGSRTKGGKENRNDLRKRSTNLFLAKRPEGRDVTRLNTVQAETIAK